MKQLTMKNMQDYLKSRYGDKGNTSSLFMKLVEEVGEVAEVLNKRDGRKKDDNTTTLAEELVDVIHYAVAIASIENIDLTKEIIEKDKCASIKYNHTINLEEFLKTHE